MTRCRRSERLDDRRRPIVAAARKWLQLLEGRGATVTEDHHGTYSVIAYYLPAASFEVELDWREQAAFVLVCRATTGYKRAPGYYMDEGRLMRVHIADALGRLGLMEPGLRRRLQSTIRTSGPEAMHAQLQTQGSVLAAKIDQLTEGYGEIFK